MVASVGMEAVVGEEVRRGAEAAGMAALSWHRGVP